MGSLAKSRPATRPSVAGPAAGLEWVHESFRDSPDTVMVLDSFGLPLASNRAPSQPDGFCGPEADPVITAALTRAIETRQAVVAEAQALRPDGSPGWYRVSLTPVVRQGRVHHLTLIASDITDRKLAENAVAEHAAQLARLNADLEQFARIAAHDLQEPLRTVASFVELLEVQYRGQLDADADETIQFIVEGVHRMKAVISDLLEYSQLRLSPGAVKAVDLNERLARIRKQLVVQHADSGATLQSAELPAVHADPVLVHKLLMHLAANAIRFHGQQPPCIEVTARIERDRVEVCVRDNGIGIAPAQLERVFVIFQRLNPDMPGTGAGLAICRKIVELHGGRIWAESQPGQGTAIRFTLPAAC